MVDIYRALDDVKSTRRRSRRTPFNIAQELLMRCAHGTTGVFSDRKFEIGLSLPFYEVLVAWHNYASLGPQLPIALIQEEL